MENNKLLKADLKEVNNFNIVCKQCRSGNTSVVIDSDYKGIITLEFNCETCGSYSQELPTY